jgi:hypothetical protein
LRQIRARLELICRRKQTVKQRNPKIKTRARRRRKASRAFAAIRENRLKKMIFVRARNVEVSIAIAARTI